MVRSIAAGAAVTTLALVSGCSSSKSDGDAPTAQKIEVQLSADGCGPQPNTIPAGSTTFHIVNKDAGKASEVELRTGDGSNIVGEKENLTPGLSGSFTVRLEPGRYQMYCPGAKNVSWPLDVKVSTTSAPSVSTAGAQAAKDYQTWVISEVAQLVPAATTFVNAVIAGNISAAKAAYAPARAHYESVEPVAESFGGLDPDIDARIDDVTSESKWTGFHRLEKALWADNSVSGMAPIARKLLSDVKRLQKLVKTDALQPAQMANGAVELLSEVAKSKVTGEEDRYSHTDLWDFAANVQGSRKAFDLLAPVVRVTNATLAQTIKTRFIDLQTELTKFRSGSGYVVYTQVTQAQRRVLAQKVNAVAEPLSHVAPLVA